MINNRTVINVNGGDSLPSSDAEQPAIALSLHPTTLLDQQQIRVILIRNIQKFFSFGDFKG